MAKKRLISTSTAKKSAAKMKKKRISLKSLQAVTKGSPWQRESAGDFIRRMRDDARY